MLALAKQYCAGNFASDRQTYAKGFSLNAIVDVRRRHEMTCAKLIELATSKFNNNVAFEFDCLDIPTGNDVPSTSSQQQIA